MAMCWERGCQMKTSNSSVIRWMVWSYTLIENLSAAHLHWQPRQRCHRLSTKAGQSNSSSYRICLRKLVSQAEYTGKVCVYRERERVKSSGLLIWKLLGIKLTVANFY